MPFWLAGPVGVGGTILLGLTVALPALRTRGLNLAVGTLGLALVVQAMILGSSTLTGGIDGLTVGTPSLFGIDLDPTTHPERYAMLALAVLLVAGLMVANLRRGRTGRRLLAVRSNERAAASVGVGVYFAKLHAFGVGGLLAGIAGVLVIFRSPTAVFSQFDIFGSITTARVRRDRRHRLGERGGDRRRARPGCRRGQPRRQPLLDRQVAAHRRRARRRADAEAVARRIGGDVRQDRQEAARQAGAASEATARARTCAAARPPAGRDRTARRDRPIRRCRGVGQGQPAHRAGRDRRPHRPERRRQDHPARRRQRLHPRRRGHGVDGRIGRSTRGHRSAGPGRASPGRSRRSSCSRR